MADLEKEQKPPTPEAPKVERAPEVPKPPETAQELDDLGSAWDAFIERGATEAKTSAEQSMQAAPERLGVGPEEAAKVAAETGITVERAQAESALDTAAKSAEAEIGDQTGKEAPKEMSPEAASQEKPKTAGEIFREVDQKRTEMRIQTATDVASLSKKIKSPHLSGNLFRAAISKDGKPHSGSLLPEASVVGVGDLSQYDQRYEDLTKKIRTVEERSRTARLSDIEKHNLEKIRQERAKITQEIMTSPAFEDDMKVWQQIKDSAFETESQIRELEKKLEKPK